MTRSEWFSQRRRVLCGREAAKSDSMHAERGSNPLSMGTNACNRLAHVREKHRKKEEKDGKGNGARWPVEREEARMKENIAESDRAASSRTGNRLHNRTWLRDEYTEYVGQQICSRH